MNQKVNETSINYNKIQKELFCKSKEIIKYLHYSELFNLELTCSLLKNNIDAYYSNMISSDFDCLNDNNSAEIKKLNYKSINNKQKKILFDNKKRFISSYLNEFKLINLDSFKFDENLNSSLYDLFSNPLNNQLINIHNTHNLNNNSKLNNLEKNIKDSHNIKDRKDSLSSESNYALNFIKEINLNISSFKNIFSDKNITQKYAFNEEFKDVTEENCRILDIIFSNDITYILFENNKIKLIKTDICMKLSFIKLKPNDKNEIATKILYCQEFKILFYLTNKRNLYYIYYDKNNKLSNDKLISCLLMEYKNYYFEDTSKSNIKNNDINLEIKLDSIYLIKNFFIVFDKENNKFYYIPTSNLLPLINFNMIEEKDEKLKNNMSDGNCTYYNTLNKHSNLNCDLMLNISDIDDIKYNCSKLDDNTKNDIILKDNQLIIKNSCFLFFYNIVTDDNYKKLSISHSKSGITYINSNNNVRFII